MRECGNQWVIARQMKYADSKEFVSDNAKSILVFGMSGVGKSHVSRMLCKDKRWKSHSIDQRICEILDRHLLYNKDLIEQREVLAAIKTGDLKFLTRFLGKPGSLQLGGLNFNDYVARQNIHAAAEKLALVEAPHIYDKARKGSEGGINFICDTGGSICEVLDPVADHRLLTAISRRMLFVYIRAEKDYDEQLMQRFKDDPKPMYYGESFLNELWSTYKKQQRISDDNEVDPNQFSVWGFRQLLDHRRPLYEAIAERYGIEVIASDISSVRDQQDFIGIVGKGIDQRKKVQVPQKSIGRVFAEQRKVLNYSKKNVASSVGINLTMLTKLERSLAQPSERLEQKMYEVLYLHPQIKAAVSS